MAHGTAARAAILKMRPDSKYFRFGGFPHGRPDPTGGVPETDRLAGAAREIIHGSKFEIIATDTALPQNTLRGQARGQFSDKYASGSSTGMHYYLNLWSHLERYWRECAPIGGNSSELPCGTQVVGERLMYRHMNNAPFQWSPPPQVERPHRKPSSLDERAAQAISNAQNGALLP